MDRKDNFCFAGYGCIKTTGSENLFALSVYLIRINNSECVGNIRGKENLELSAHAPSAAVFAFLLPELPYYFFRL